jgi:hypothetical protein
MPDIAHWLTQRYIEVDSEVMRKVVDAEFKA